MAVSSLSPIRALDRAGVPFRVAFDEAGRWDFMVKHYVVEDDDDLLADADYTVDVYDGAYIVDFKFLFRSSYGDSIVDEAFDTAIYFREKHPECLIVIEQD